MALLYRGFDVVSKTKCMSSQALSWVVGAISHNIGDHLPTTYQPPSPTTYQPPLSTTYQPRTNHIPSTHQAHTDWQINLFTITLFISSMIYLFIPNILWPFTGWFFHGNKAQHLKKVILHHISVHYRESITRQSSQDNSRVTRIYPLLVVVYSYCGLQFLTALSLTAVCFNLVWVLPKKDFQNAFCHVWTRKAELALEATFE